MKTQATEFTSLNLPMTRAWQAASGWLQSIPTISLALRLLRLAALPVLPVLAAWGTAHGAPDVVAMLEWMAGIAFLAVAVDARGQRAAWLALTGLALFTLAWLASRAAPEFGIAGAALVAGWVAVRR